jgi:hypothetical protein
MEIVTYFDALRKLNPTIENLAGYVAGWCPNYLKIDHSDSPAQSQGSGTPTGMTGVTGTLTTKSSDIVLYSGYISLSVATGTIREPTIQFQIKRDSTVIQTFEVRSLTTTGDSTGGMFGASFSGSDTPGAGTFTYAVLWAVNGATGGTTAYSRKQLFNLWNTYGIVE